MDTNIDLTPRQKALLTFLGADGGERLDPIRIQKGLFILSMETPQDWLPPEARYDFEPYHYGPFASAIYHDLDELEGRGYVERMKVAGRSWDYYALSPEGTDAAESTSREMDTRALQYFQRIRDFVGMVTFRTLLTAVYERYPRYAVNSVFKH